MSCVSVDDKYTTQNLGHKTETIFMNFVQENCSNALEALVSLDNENDKQDINVCESESTSLVVEVNSFNNNSSEENFLTKINDRSNASNNNDFPDIIANSEIKKAIIAARPKQSKRLFPKDPLQHGCWFSTNYDYCVAQRGLKLQRYWLCYSPSMERVYCQPCLLFFHENASPGTSIPM